MWKEFLGCQGTAGDDRLNQEEDFCVRGVGGQARIWQADGFPPQEHVLTNGPSG